MLLLVLLNRFKHWDWNIFEDLNIYFDLNIFDLNIFDLNILLNRFKHFWFNRYLNIEIETFSVSG